MQSLRNRAQQHGVYIGTCACCQALESDPLYTQTLAHEFNIITPENALKFGSLSPKQGVYNFEAADALVSFAEANGMKVRGHVLVWNDQLPLWLTEGNFTRSELIEIITNHIKIVVGRYAGRIGIWDVVNEAIDDNGLLRESIWSRTIGREYIDIAFNTAREADPNALLFYNDFGLEGTIDHENGVYELLRDLTERSVPVDGIGLQMHLHVNHFSSLLYNPINLQRLNDLALLIHITELDVRIPLNEATSPDQLLAQALVYGNIIKWYLANSNCKTIILWGFTDRHSWIPYFFPGEGAAMIFDKEYNKKPSYDAVAAGFDILK